MPWWFYLVAVAWSLAVLAAVALVVALVVAVTRCDEDEHQALSLSVEHPYRVE